MKHQRQCRRFAQSGDGNAAYINPLSGARRALLEVSASTLGTITKGPKIQVEVNPASVSDYRFIGYEVRMHVLDDFRNDKVDAGEVGAGHAVTALYDLMPAGPDGGRIAPLRYREDGAAALETAFESEHTFVKTCYKLVSVRETCPCNVRRLRKVLSIVPALGRAMMPP